MNFLNNFIKFMKFISTQWEIGIMQNRFVKF